MFSGRQLRSGQKGGAGVGKTKRGKGCKIMALGDAHGLPIAIHTEAAAPAEVKLVAATLEQCLVKKNLCASSPTGLMIAIRCASNCSKRRYCSWHRTVADEPSPLSTTAGGCAATLSAGKSNASSPGFTTLEDSLSAGNTMPKTISPFFNLDAQLSFCGIYEMACSVFEPKFAEGRGANCPDSPRTIRR